MASDPSFEVNVEGLGRAVALLSGRSPSGLPPFDLPALLPLTGLGEVQALERLAPDVLGRATYLDAGEALAHMDPPTPWISWAMALWNARLNQNLLHPATAPFAREAEARVLGVELGLAPAFVDRHPFPGPGLAIRIPGEITPQKVATLQQADAIYLEEIRKAGLYDKIWQAFAVLLPVKTVGVMGDARTYEDVLALRAVTSTDGMTADFFEFPWEVLGRCATRIINEVRGVNRVVYDVTSKPPGTIEWE